MKWIDILKEITDIAIFKAGDYDELEMTIEFDFDEGWVDSQCQIEKSGKSESIVLGDDAFDEVIDLTRALRDAMHEHTGGNLKKYTIRIDETGKAKANFEYHDPQPAVAN